MNISDMPAFPVDTKRGVIDFKNHNGLTKREYFAAMAMQGSITRGRDNQDDIAKWAVEYSEALLAELEKK